MNSDYVESKKFMYVHMAICLLGLSTNLINLIVFLNINKRTKIQNMSIFWSILDFLYSSFLIFDYIIILTYSDTLLSNIVDLYIYKFFTSCMAMMIICIQIFVYSRHYLLIKKKEMFFIKVPIHTLTYLIIFLFIGLVVYLPIIFIYNIVLVDKTSKETIYKIENNSGTLAAIFIFITTSIRCSVSFVLVIMLNMMIYVKYKKVLVFSKSK